MAQFSNNRYFSALDVPGSNDLHVYVDGSFDTEAVSFYRRHFIGAGWTVVNPAGYLIGYGVSSFKTRSSNSSECMELKAMLEFLDAMYSDFPELINKDRKITIFGDNQYLLRSLHKAKTDRQMSRHLFNRLGYDYLRLVYYMTAMNLDFRWVKGHATSRFNRLADNMARHAYREQLRKGHFDGPEREHYLFRALEIFNKTNSKFLTIGDVQQMVKGKKTKTLSKIPSMKVSMSHVMKDGRTVATFEYIGSHGNGTRHAVLLKKHSILYLSLRACRYALSENVQQMDGNKTFVLHINDAETAGIINSLVKKKPIKAHANNPRILHEIDRLGKLLQGKHVVAISHESLQESKRHKTKARNAVNTVA